IPFDVPATVPLDGEDFTRWFAAKAQRFFGVRGPEYEDLFGSHLLDHKATGKDKSLTFDGLCCDGAGNYLKARLDGERYRAEEFKARSYGEESKTYLKRWMLETYFHLPGTCGEIPAPVTGEVELLSLGPAVRHARAALAATAGPVYLPLGL